MLRYLRGMDTQHRIHISNYMCSVLINFLGCDLLQQGAEGDAESDVSGGSIKCEPCNKRFNSDNAYQNHLSSKKHKETLAKPKSSNKGKGAAVAAVSQASDPLQVSSVSALCKLCNDCIPCSITTTFLIRTNTSF